MLKRKDLIRCIISIIMLVLAIATNVFATNDVGVLLGNNNAANNNAPQNIEPAPINNTTSNNLTPNNITPNNVNSNNTTKIPYTGVNYSVVVVIAICGISTIYAYKKIRDYNI